MNLTGAVYIHESDQKIMTDSSLITLVEIGPKEAPVCLSVITHLTYILLKINKNLLFILVSGAYINPPPYFASKQLGDLQVDKE